MPTPANDSHLLSHLRADVSRRWQAGDRVRVESYLEQYPELASDVEAVLELLGAEALLRQENGEPPDLEELVARFPQYAGPIRLRWAVLRMLARGGTLADPTHADGPRPPIGPPDVPGYEILDELGRGGMGVVYLARQHGVERLVALKLIRERLREGDGATRFRIEAQAVGRLRHPCVVAALAFVQAGDWLGLAMEYLPGGSLADLLRRGRLEPVRAAELARDVALGLHAAHEADVVHRDLKPANVLLDADGHARVADFGLARLLDSDDHVTASHAVLGTPAYMAPEQAAGLARDVGPAADVWALGAILYQCLTGRVPFRGATSYQTLQQIRNAPLTPPRAIRPDVPADLDLVCRKCLQKDPYHRYRSAADVAADLNRYLRGEQVRTRVRETGAWAWMRGQSFLWHAGLVALAFLMAGTAVALAPERREVAPLPEPSALQATDLIRDGRPRVYRAVLGRKHVTMASYPASHFAVSSPGLGLVELTPDPRQSSYRLRAELRHLRSYDATSRVGLYVGHRVERGQPNPVHRYLMVGFNDVYCDVRAFRETVAPLLPKVDPNDVPKGNRLDVLPCVFAGSPLQEDYQIAVGGINNPKTFEAHGHEDGPWRTLTVEVTPEKVRVFWGRGEPAGVLDADDLERDFAQALAPRGGKGPAFLPRGGLGLYVQRGYVAYRNVVLEPLPPGAARP